MVLIAVPKSLLSQWHAEFVKWQTDVFEPVTVWTMGTYIPRGHLFGF
jgi:hypothetical protein